MKVCCHIAYYHYLEKPDYSKFRSKNLCKIIEEYLSTWEDVTIDIFIHTNSELTKIITNFIDVKDSIKISVIVYDFTKESPDYLTWKHRDLMEKQIHNYDVFLYMEDDIGIPYKTFQYWLKYKDALKTENLDLGFCLIESLNNKDWFCSTILKPCSVYIKIMDRYFAWNHQNYSAFWICDKEEMNRFINSVYWKRHGYFPEGPGKPEGPHIRESAAIGFKMSYNRFCVGSFYPLTADEKNVSDICYVYHVSANYINSEHEQGKFPVTRLAEEVHI
jgi:hypothetical protein